MAGQEASSNSTKELEGPVISSAASTKFYESITRLVSVEKKGKEGHPGSHDKDCNWYLATVRMQAWEILY